MSRALIDSVALGAALRRFSWAFLFVAAVVIDATSTQRHLRHIKAAQQSTGSCACASLLQADAVQDPAATTQCPCLVTPAPLMTPEASQAAAVEAAADTAALSGTQEIQKAGDEAAAPIKEEIEKLDVEKEVGGPAKEAFQATTAAAGAKIKQDIGALIAEEKKELDAMSQTAKNIGAVGAEHLRKTTEDWAANQAQNYIVEHASTPLKEAAELAKKTEDIRQKATETTKTAIQASQESVKVAQTAQAAIAMVPKDSFKKAGKNAEEAAAEQVKLKEEIALTEETVRQIATVAQESAVKARDTLHEAEQAKEMAKAALAKSRSNAEKIELLKTRSQAAYEKSKKAKEAMEGVA